MTRTKPMFFIRSGIAFANDRLYVVDGENDKVYVYDGTPSAGGDGSAVTVRGGRYDHHPAHRGPGFPT